MELMFSVISRHKFALANAGTYVFSKSGGYVGRDELCEWYLPDKQKKVSRKHFLVTSNDQGFYIEDLSKNGTFLVLGRERIPRGRRIKVEHGSSYYVGDYTIQATLLYSPDAHLPGAVSVNVDQLIPDDAFLDLDPLVAMEQQDDHEAKRRLGLYNDLLGESAQKVEIPADHSEPSTDSMLSIKGIPEDWNNTAPLREPIQEVIVPDPEPLRKVEAVPETDKFFRLLGFTTIPESPEERERIMAQAAELLLASVESMLQSLRNRADSKNDLRLTVTTMTLASNNPLKFSPTAKAALEYLLGAPQEGMLSHTQAMLTAFNDLHSHHMGLLAGARAAVGAALERISPEHVEASADAKGIARFNRNGRLWNEFRMLHQKYKHSPDYFTAAFFQDFARAYEVQVRTLHPTPKSLRRE